MVQLLSRKNKKGAAFFVRQRLFIHLFSCITHNILLQQKSAFQLHKKPKSAICPFTFTFIPSFDFRIQCRANCFSSPAQALRNSFHDSRSWRRSRRQKWLFRFSLTPASDSKWPTPPIQIDPSIRLKVTHHSDSDWPTLTSGNLLLIQWRYHHWIRRTKWGRYTW